MDHSALPDLWQARFEELAGPPCVANIAAVAASGLAGQISFMIDIDAGHPLH
jgi:hypothetical protein